MFKMLLTKKKISLIYNLYVSCVQHYISTSVYTTACSTSKFSFHLSAYLFQSLPTLWGPMGYTVHGILQARILEWVAFPFFRGSSQPRD